MPKMLVVGIAVVGITFTIHAVGSTWWIGLLIRRYADPDGTWRSGTTAGCVVSTGIVLLVLHLLEAFAWAVAYLRLPGNTNLKSLEEAAYFSIVTFTTLGYGDITLSPPWRLLSGIEAVNGILLAGWSTALLFTVVQHIWKLGHQPEQKH